MDNLTVSVPEPKSLNLAFLFISLAIASILWRRSNMRIGFKAFFTFPR
jgi:hypothetical protein